MRSWRSPGGRWLVAFWRLFQLLTVAAVCWAGWRLLGHAIYRIDVEVYRMGAQAWLSGRPLYSAGATFHTSSGLDLPFTYPPLSAIIFSPFAWLTFGVSGVVMTLITFLLLVVSTVIVLTGLNVWPTSTAVPGPAWLRRWWLAVAIVAAAVIYLEPIQSNLSFGQINVVLMTLVLADCVPRRTPWPRGLLLGLAIALKLTPAAFLLYFALRRDGRAALTATVSFVAATVGGFVLAWRDSLEYWTATVRNTDRIGSAALNTNQNVAGMLARSELTRAEQFVLWTLVCLLILAVTVWAGQRVLRAGEPVLALMCVALFGLLVSPVSWSHHWVWVLPVVLTTGVLAVRRRSLALAAMTMIGVAVTVWTPIDLMPKHHEATASWWRQLVGVSYVWWALAVIVVAGATVAARVAQRTRANVGEAAPDATTVPAIS